jgi:hypothetical protein
MNYILTFFEYAHLPERLQGTSRLFWELAQQVNDKVPDNSEKTAALRKLLEAKDCAVRAVLLADMLANLPYAEAMGITRTSPDPDWGRIVSRAQPSAEKPNRFSGIQQPQSITE